jgi:hypothetical protein
MAERCYLTIVSGLPRSGTSLMMQMITAGGIPPLTDHVRAADEDNPRGYYEYEPVKRTKDDPSWVADGVGKVVKMVHLLLLDLPAGFPYRVVFMRRNLEEVLVSQDVMLERRGKGKGEVPKERLMTLYRLQIQKVQDHMRQNAERFAFLEVNYNAVMADPRPQAEMVSQFLDGLDVEGMSAVVDPSLYRKRADG